MEIKRVKVIVEGVVQGVFFRAYTEQKARELKLKGTVRNLVDGNVEINAQGTDSQLKSLIEWCWQGSPASSVRNVTVKELNPSELLQDFRIVR